MQQWIKYGKRISERLFYCVTKLILAQDDSNHLQLEQEELNILTGLKPHTLIFHFLKSQFNSTSLLSLLFFFFPNALFAITSPLNASAEKPLLFDTPNHRLLRWKWSARSLLGTVTSRTPCKADLEQPQHINHSLCGFEMQMFTFYCNINMICYAKHWHFLYL